MTIEEGEGQAALRLSSTTFSITMERGHCAHTERKEDQERSIQARHSSGIKTTDILRRQKN